MVNKIRNAILYFGTYAFAFGSGINASFYALSKYIDFGWYENRSIIKPYFIFAFVSLLIYKILGIEKVNNKVEVFLNKVYKKVSTLFVNIFSRKGGF